MTNGKAIKFNYLLKLICTICHCRMDTTSIPVKKCILLKFYTDLHVDMHGTKCHFISVSALDKTLTPHETAHENLFTCTLNISSPWHVYTYSPPLSSEMVTLT